MDQSGAASFLRLLSGISLLVVSVVQPAYPGLGCAVWTQHLILVFPTNEHDILRHLCWQ